jgi:hypothetical protein
MRRSPEPAQQQANPAKADKLATTNQQTNPSSKRILRFIQETRGEQVWTRTQIATLPERLAAVCGHGILGRWLAAFSDFNSVADCVFTLR